MQHTYRITTASRPKVLMRLLQVFDQQQLTIRSLGYVWLHDHIRITLRVDLEPELAARIRAKLHNQTDVTSVDVSV